MPRLSGTEPVQRVLYYIQLMPDVFHHAIDAVGVFQDVHTLSVGVVVYCEWTQNGLGKLPADTAKSLISQSSSAFCISHS